MRNLSIKRKLTLIIMTASTVALLLISAGFVAYELLTFQQTMRQDLFTQAEMVGSLSTGALTFGEGKDARDFLVALSARKHIQAAAIYQGTNEMATLFAWYPTNAAPSGFPVHPQRSGYNKFDFKHDNLVIFQEIKQSGETVGTVYVKSDLGEMYERLDRYGIMFALFMLATSVITYLLSDRLQQIISKPIFHLLQTTRTVSQQKNYSARAEKHAHDELGQLIDGFNEMLGQIQERDAALQSAKDGLEKRVQERTQDLELEIAERKRAEEALQEQFTRTNLLNHIAQVISERQDLESILYVVLRQLEDHLGVDLGVVSLFEHAAETLNVAALRLKNPLLSSKLDLHEGMVLPLDHTGLRLCRHGETIYISDTNKNPALFIEKFAHAGFRSAVAVPLMVENKLFGTLAVGRLAVDNFNPGECEFLRTLSEHVALAAHQAQLHAELEKAYNDLRQTQQTVMQQERLKALGQMASGIAHDVNNALSPVVGFADLLAKGETLTPSGRKYLHYIKTAGEDIAHIVARLREFYRQRDDAEKLQSLSLNELAKQVMDMTRPRWRDIPQGRGVMIEMRSDLDVNLPELVGIESEVREALTNLILNAVDAIPNGGTITVRTRIGAREFSTNTPTYVILEVADTGVGMDEETRKRCLEPFFSTKGQRGTGLGLAMVYGVMERHEGQIEIDSEVGKGTTVKLIFPIRRLAAHGELEHANEETPAPLHVLCIDDEPLLRELLREMLERDGHKTVVKDGGQAGVEAFRIALSQGRPFDAVVTDLGMPYFDGRQVAKMIKRESPETPVIMLTGWGAFMKEDGDVPAQVDGILSKPPRSAELREMLRRITRKHDTANKDLNAKPGKAAA